jgi:sialidase-1
MRAHRDKFNTIREYCFYIIILLGIPFAITAQQPVFTAGENGYATFRIPAIVQLPNGNLLAFCEARVRNASDFGNIDIVMKRSVNEGRSWSSLQVIVNADSLQAGNPAPVVDLLDPAFPNGQIFLFYNTGNHHENEVRKGNGERQVWYTTSVDDGNSWSDSINISSQVHRQGPPQNWRSYANTPGHGLQIQKGRYKGRIYIAANHSAGNPQPGFKDYRAHGFFTDDHGEHFTLSESVSIDGSNESTAAYIGNDRLMLNSRDQQGDHRMRIVSISSDGGYSWDSSYFDPHLIDPVCQGSLLNIGWKRRQPLLAFSNPASRSSRDSLTLRISRNGGSTWIDSLLIDYQHGGSSTDYTAYSDLVLMRKKQIGILYERNNYREIVFKTIRLNQGYKPVKAK